MASAKKTAQPFTLSIEDYKAATSKGRRSERPIQRWVLQYLRTHPRVNKSMIFRMNVGGFYRHKGSDGKWHATLRPTRVKGESWVGFGETGWSDIWFTLKPHNTLSVFETKAKNDKPTEKQEQFLEAVRAAGGIAAAVWTPEDVMRELPA